MKLNYHNWLVLLLACCLCYAPALLAQDADGDRSDAEFVKEMQARLQTVGRRAENLENYAKRRMGVSTGSGNRIGVEPAHSPGGYGTRSTTSSTASDAHRIRLNMRSLQKKAERESKRFREMLRETPSDQSVNRGYMRSTVLRMERELDETERELRRL